MQNLHAIKIHLASSQIRRKTFNNSQHLVLPVVMLKVGVHAGSGGPLFYPEDELKNATHLWNGKPVLVNHPTNCGQPVSANSPRVWEGQVLGQIWNAQFERDMLKAEIWLDEKRVQSIAPQLLTLINQGANIDVSTGLFTSDEEASGVWNGEKYVAIARRHVPDHLAILPDSRGACSWSDGCGIRVNSINELIRNIDNAYSSYLRNGGYNNMNDEKPLLMPNMNEAINDKENHVLNTMQDDEYDMNITRLWGAK